MRRHLRRPRPLLLALSTLVPLFAACQTPARPESSSPANRRAERSNTASESDEHESGSPRFDYVESLGGEGTERGALRGPIGAAVDDGGVLHVSEGGNDRLQTFDAEGQSVAVWAEGIGRPMHIAFDGEGRLLVPAYREDRILLFDESNERVDSFGGDWVDGPAGVAAGPKGRYVVADFYNHAVHIVGGDGAVDETIGSKGTGPGEFTYPTDVEVTPKGDIWVADAYAHRVQILAPDGTHRRTVGRKGTEKPGRFHVATGIDRGPDGHLYVADFKNDRVQVLDPGGEVLAVLDGADGGDASMRRPTDVVAAAGRLHVVDHGNHQIDVYRRAAK